MLIMAKISRCVASSCLLVVTCKEFDNNETTVLNVNRTLLTESQKIWHFSVTKNKGLLKISCRAEFNWSAAPIKTIASNIPETNTWTYVYHALESEENYKYGILVAVTIPLVIILLAESVIIGVCLLKNKKTTKRTRLIKRAP